MTQKIDDAAKWMHELNKSTNNTFCAAKWYNASIWLGNGMTASCHHPPPHKIDPEEVKQNPNALHNTLYKKLVRKEMQEGKQTRECEYCWKIENLNKNLTSDRFYKSSIYDLDENVFAFKQDWKQDIDLKTLEISFDSNCNLACSYCNAGFSTTWAHDINKNGAYQNLISDGWGAFAHNGQWAMPYGPKNENNPFIAAFWKLWENKLQYSLTELRITGGEAMVSKHFWKLIDWFEQHPQCNVRLGINTNLIAKREHLDRLCELSKYHEVILYTSNESYGIHAEYIRDELVWDEWIDNFKYVIHNGSFKHIHVMMTISALCLVSMDKFHEEIVNIRRDATVFVDSSHNILRFPSFQSIVTLPNEIRLERAAHYENWLADNKDTLHTHEIDGITRVIEYIRNVDEGHSITDYSDLNDRQRDFKSFFVQYDDRRNKDFNSAFSDWPMLLEWYNTIDATENLRKLDTLVDADATAWGKPIFSEILKNYEDNV